MGRSGWDVSLPLWNLDGPVPLRVRAVVCLPRLQTVLARTSSATLNLSLVTSEAATKEVSPD